MSSFNKNIHFSVISKNNFPKKLNRYFFLEMIIRKFLFQNNQVFNKVWFKESPVCLVIYIEFFEKTEISLSKSKEFQFQSLFFQKHIEYLFNYQKPTIFLYSNLFQVKQSSSGYFPKVSIGSFLESIIYAIQGGFFVAEALVRSVSQLLEKSSRPVFFLDNLFTTLDRQLFRKSSKVKGFRFKCSGRLGGSDRSKTIIFQRKQLSFKNRDNFKKINSAFYPVKTAYGLCGIFFWVVFK